jgi:thiosulfate/3-mercaptopyruvate sulfurtransferase
VVLLSSRVQGRVGWAARAAQDAGGYGCGAAPLTAGAFGIAARCNATSSSAVSEAAGVHALPRTEPVVSAEWLHANLKDPDVKVRCSQSQYWASVICNWPVNYWLRSL